jgi:hypothetical protein
MKKWKAFPVGALIVVIGCGSRGNKTSASAKPDAAAPDQLTDQEREEGDDEAFGLMIPRGLRVVSRDTYTVTAQGMMDRDTIANYVRARVSGGRVELGPQKTTFIGVTVTTPVHPFRGSLTIDVSLYGRLTTLKVYADPIFDVPYGRQSHGTSAPKPK